MTIPARAAVSTPSGPELEQLHRAVLTWYAGAARPLPWRAAGTTPWGVLVSEVMAQQTQVSRVAPRWTEWVARWPTPAALAAADPAEVLRAWSGLGYPRRARNLHATAARLVADHDGRVPADAVTLRSLPGIGPYTAAAVCAFGYGQRIAVVDVNVERVLTRAIIATPASRRMIHDLATSLLPVEASRAAAWSQAVMEVGAVCCTARTPTCAVCPLRTTCAWLRAGQPAMPTTRPQPRFAGSVRQARGLLLRAVHDGPVPRTTALSLVDPDAAHPAPSARAQAALTGLLADGLLVELPGDLLALPTGMWKTRSSAAAWTTPPAAAAQTPPPSAATSTGPPAAAM